jgi:hypothetical protein
MKRIAFIALVALCGCASAPSRPTGDAKKSVLFGQPIEKVQKVAVDSLAVLGFEMSKTEPTYVEGHRPHRMGLFVGSGGETVGVWLEQVGADATRVEVDTARSIVGIVGQKSWDDEVFAEMQKSLGPPRATN